MITFSDLHCHLGGSTSPNMLKSIAYNRGIKTFPKDFGDFSDMICGKKSKKQFEDYLNRYKIIQRIQSSPESIRDSVFSAFQDAYINGSVRLMELKFNPMLRNMDGIYDIDVVISSACDGLNKTKSVFNDMKCGLVIESDRSFSNDLTDILANKAIKFKDKGVVGFDVSGFDNNFDIKLNTADFIKIIEKIVTSGLGITLHLNENKEEEVCDDVIHLINRMGHGIKTSKSNLQRFKDINKDLSYEICPISNINSGVISNISELNNFISELKSLSIDYTISTDGHIFNKNVEDNIMALFPNTFLEELSYSNVVANKRTFIQSK